MRLFDLPQAQHFCTPSAAVTAGIGAQSLSAYQASLGKGVTRLQEGSVPFHVHQLNLLHSVDRWLLYSVSHYRRTVDMLVPASAPLAQVSLYYASFFAANAILGMFGGWVGHVDRKTRVVDVDNGVQGSQELQIHRGLTSPNGAGGSHRAFWDFFYDASAAIVAWAPPKLALALSPVNGDFAWQIAERNAVNYDMHLAWDSSLLFFGTFNPSRLRTLSGPLKLQLEATERIVTLGLHFADKVALTTNALNGCGQTGSTVQIRKKLASQRPPQLVTQSAFSGMV